MKRKLRQDSSSPSAPKSAGGDKEPPELKSDAVRSRLEAELQRLKDQLQTTVERYETTVEVLKASNQEMQSINEELLSTGKELETSKKELQSVNEELRAVNLELKHKIEEVSETNDDLKNLMASTEIATIFLDRSLRIKRYTPRAADIFSLIPADAGRPLTDITHKLNYQNLHADAETVINSLQPVEREVSGRDGRYYIARLLPYRTMQDRIGGVVLNFVDITERKRAEQALRETEARMRLIIESAKDYAIFTTDLERRVNSWNSGAEAMMGYTESEIVGERDDIIFTPEDRASGAPEYEAETALTLGRAGNERWHSRKDGSHFYGSGLTMPLRDDAGKIIGFVKIMRDLSEQKRAEVALHENEARQAFLLKLSDAVRPLVDPVEIQYVASRVLGEHLGVNRAFYTEIEGDDYLFVGHFSHDAPFLPPGRYPSDAFGQDVIKALRAGRSVVVEDTEMDARFTPAHRKAYAAIAVRAYATVPLLKAGRFVALLGVHTAAPRAWTANDLALIEVTAERTWAAVQRARAEKALRMSEDRLRQAMQTAALMWWEVDVATGLSIMSPNYPEVVGFSDDLLTKDAMESIAKFMLPEDADGFAAALQKTMRGEGDLFYEYRVFNPQTNKIHWIEASGTLITGANQHSPRVIGVARNITERKEAEEALHRAHDELERQVLKRTRELREVNEGLQAEIAERKQLEGERRRLLRRIVEAQEAERQRISRELHDHLGQQMTALRLGIKSLWRQSPGPSKEPLEKVEEIMNRLDADLDFLAWELRPAALDELGLSAAIANFVHEWSKQFGVDADFHAAGMKKSRFSREVETNLYRIAQEALNNIAKHAQASHAAVILERREDSIRMVLEDNGIGFDLTEGATPAESGKGLGIISMRERAALCGGTLEIESSPGGGVTIFVQIPELSGDEKEKENAAG